MANDPARHSIGAVLRALQPDFPDISASKIRFLEAEGLVAPARTGSGYRTFSDDDIERLRFILTAQRDRYWPLRVIADALAAMDRGMSVDGDGVVTAGPPTDTGTVAPAALRARATLRLTERELRDEAGLDEASFAALRTFGLLAADASGHYDSDALAVARAAGALAAYGVEPRHLRAFRTAADREIGLVEQIVGPARAVAGKRAGAIDPTADVLAACLDLHVALVRSGLRRG